jgi:hypothetical protein
LGGKFQDEVSMRLRNITVLVSGLGIFAAGIVLGMVAVNHHSPLYVTLLGITAAILALTGFEFCRYAFSSRDKEYRFFSRGYRGLIFDLVNILLAVCLTIGTVTYQRPSDPLCRGQLSAGFPVAFICDAQGESPLSSVRKINWADIDSLNPIGGFVDAMFYTALLWITSFMVLRVLKQIHKSIQSR